MGEIAPYADGKGVESAIKAAAQKAQAEDPSLTISERIRLEYFNRFLSRVFSEGHESEWVLKGGAGMLARVPSTRATRDIDLYRRGYDLDEAIADLRRLAGVDLGDHFRFVYAGHHEILTGEEQPYTEGYRVQFDTYIGAQKKGGIGIDLSGGAGITTEPTIATPASALNLPRLVRYDYRLYPVVDQIADKICATMQLYDGKPSSREKDLVDLVVLAVTQDIDGAALAHAIATEARRRRMEPFERLTVPSQWGAVYERTARSVPYCADAAGIDAARDLATALVDPALDATAIGLIWRAQERRWVSP